MRGLDDDDGGFDTSRGHLQVKQELDDDQQQEQPNFNDFDEYSTELMTTGGNRGGGGGDFGSAAFNYGDVEAQFNTPADDDVEDVIKMSNTADDVANQMYLDAERMAQLEREFHEQVRN